MRGAASIFASCGAVLAWAVAAGAAPGAIPISQVCALGAGCFAGDEPGFPVTIRANGAYVVTSNLVVPDASVTAIRVDGS